MTAKKTSETAKKEKPFSIFETKDINLASYLKMIGYIIKSIVVSDGRVIFGFLDKDNVKERDADVLDFYNNKGGYLRYVGCWSDLKSLLHNYRK